MPETTHTNYLKAMITFAKAIDFLLGNDYLAVVNGEIVITNKLKREFKPIPKEKIDVIFPDCPTIVSREQIWKKFIADAEIPHKGIATNGKAYTIRQYSPGIADQLIRIIKAVNYQSLVKSTALYYKSNSYKVILSNYIDKEIWKEEYERYEKAKASGQIDSVMASSSGGNRFED
jgi:hypothetical protein